MATPTVQRVDVASPYEEVKTGVDDQGQDLYDLAAVTSEELVGERVHRVFFTNPGELHHRPGWGAGLEQYASEPGTTATQQAILRDADRSLGAIEPIEDHSALVRKDAQGAFHISASVDIDGQTLEVPEVTLG